MSLGKFLKVFGAVGITALATFASFEAKDKVKEATNNEALGWITLGAIQVAGHTSALYLMKDVFED
ncbi:hypothetical protein CM19_01060 [Candidatus Acidianus copahuensis]|uniref:Uncharacterized protein n=1 Tax=Candidatus Acidianus copahuensis TaxID=1160895 RepID=A0A031LUG5_9CREN|nr:hypothetical protein [Candidatus Acidianus copahuensis]EZQ11415.1 hypothetical protein CM19_01060 [Candidatus Acidianus copahuensis]